MSKNGAAFSDREKEKALLRLRDAIFRPGTFQFDKFAALSELSSDETIRVRRAAGRLVHRVMRNADLLPSLDWNAIDMAVSMVPTTSNPVHDIASYLRLMHAISAVLKQEKLLRSTAKEIAEAGITQKLVDAVATTGDDFPLSQFTKALTYAKLESLENRATARQIYADLLSSSEFIPNAMPGEIGAATYFATEDLPLTAGWDDGFCDRLANACSGQQRGINLVLSVDPQFLRHHGATWFNLAPYFQSQNIGLIFLVAGEDDETASVIDEAKRFLATATSFHGGNPDTYRNAANFVPCSIPSTVADKKTYFACARYFLLPHVLEVTGKPALVVDVDMAFSSNIAAFVERLHGADFACPFTKGINSLYPWRRYMAGSTYFNSSKEGRLLANDVSRYITRGLTEEHGWGVGPERFVVRCRAGTPTRHSSARYTQSGPTLLPTRYSYTVRKTEALNQLVCGRGI